jgi:hypothetical protein
MDFTGILLVFDSVAIIGAISAIAAIKILPSVARWGFSQLINWFSVDTFFQSGVIHPLKPEREIKNRSARVSSLHPVDVPVFPAVESNLSPESRFKIFGAIFGFFSGFFTRFFSFFYNKR